MPALPRRGAVPDRHPEELTTGEATELMRQVADFGRPTPLFVNLFAELRDSDRLGGRCGACEFRTICGGSRSRAYACTGDVLAEEPWCGHQPDSFPYQSDLAQHLHTP
ncbi:hypothetical protein [Nonomuraea basaltis]|uniref:hypothetical protein n=1 Tax=Nonomuraea basaltis TaxID=2495887 RepID=UPI00197DCE27|nr:hypothetical protein [Nonomuraea basaltis]